MDYREFKERTQNEFNSLPLMFAFSNKQFEEGKAKLGVKDDKELTSIGGGGFIKKVDVHLLDEMIDRHNKEYEELMQNDEFVYSAFYYELSNHEFCITLDPTDALVSLCLTVEEMRDNPRLMKIFLEAKRDYLKNCIYQEVYYGV